MTLCLIKFSRGFIFFMRKCKYELIVEGSDFLEAGMQMKCLNLVLHNKKATQSHLLLIVGIFLQEIHMDEKRGKRQRFSFPT